MYNDPISNYQFETGLTDDYRNDFSPEELMWRQVILLFLQDIQKDYLVYKESLNGKRGRAYKDIELHKRIAQHKWTECVCEFASIDYNCLLDTIDLILSGKKKIIINAQFIV